MSTVEIAHDEEVGRFEIRVDGELAGFAAYERTPEVAVFHHTEIDPRFRGRGLARRVTAAALEFARDTGLTVEPVCPFVRAFIEEREEYQDLLADPPSAK